MMYPLSEYDGTMKKHDWRRSHSRRQRAARETVGAPETFFDELPAVLADAPPLPGEEARYAQVQPCSRPQGDPALKKAMIDEATKADAELVEPLFQFRNWGLQLPHHWSTIDNEAAFGTDYFTRTAVARSNIFVNAPNETKYFYQDLDEPGAPQRGEPLHRHFPKEQTPPVHGFWSLTLYNEHHFFAPNAINRYSVGTKNKALKPSPTTGR